MKKMKPLIKKLSAALAVLLCAAAVLCACGSQDDGTDGDTARTLTVAYQGGIGYAPVHIMEKLSLIEKNYGEDIRVDYVKLNSGADINTGIIGGTVDVGCMGIAPAISAVANGVDAKIIAGLCSQSNGLMTNQAHIKTLADIGVDDKIALVNTGSIQHIILAMACEKELGDAHALDNNITPMAHADGMAALEAGTADLHLTSSPFINRERANAGYTEIKEVSDAWGERRTFLAALCSTKLYAKDPALFEAIQRSFDEAVEYIDQNRQDAAQIIGEYLAQDVQTTLDDLSEESSSFFTELIGVGDVASFMARAGFLEKEISLDALRFDGVAGN